MKRSRLHSVLSCYLAAAIATGGCHGPRPVPPTPVSPAPAAPAAAAPEVSDRRPEVPIEAEPAGKLTARTVDRRVAQGNVEIANLPDDETRALQARMEPLPAIDNSGAPVVRPPSAMPQTATTSSIAFVVPTGKAVTDAPIAPGKIIAPLAAPQITPDREVRAESEIRVRFSEPMVPVAAVDTVATPNIEVEPAVTGTWRWIDTRVVQFTAAPRLPQATTYTVTVPAGIEAVSGARLGTAATQTFSTPPVQLAGTYPTGHIRPDAPIAVRFDQAVDPAKLLAKLHVGSKTVRSIPYKVIDLATAKPLWARDPSKPWNDKAAELVPGRHVILAPQTAWPSGSELTITLDKGAASNEGPRLSTEPSRVRLDVVPAFSALGIECYELPQSFTNDFLPLRPKLAGARCPARGYLTVRFSNELAQASYRSSKVQVAGEPFHDHDLSGDQVVLAVPSQVGRGYRVAIEDGLVDRYGQAMVGPRSLSFVTGPVRFFAQLDAPTGVHVLDPRFATPQWVVHADAVGSLRVQLYRVTPRDYPAFAAFEQDRRLPPPGKKFYDQVHTVGGAHWARLNADLRPGLTGGFGHVVAVATVTAAPNNLRPDRRVAWIQVTHLGATARIDGDKLNAWVRDLDPQAFLTARAGVDVALAVEGRPEVHAATAADGHVALDLPPALPRKLDQPSPIAVLRMTSGADSAFAVIGRHEQTQRIHDALWYVTDDRFTYKPGESVYVKGWVRWTHNGPNPDLAMPNPGEQVSYTLVDARGSKIASGQVALTERGGFDVEVALPKNINLGQASFTFVTRGDSTRHPIAVQEFRTPAYAVTLDDDVGHHGAIPLILGEGIEMTAGARYYAGGGLGGAAIDWQATLTATRFQPPGWSRFAFDPPRSRARRSWYYDRYGDDATVSANQTGSLSGASTASVTWGVAALPRNQPAILAVDATVTDVDRMSIRASSRPILVHPAAYYVGLRLAPRDPETLQAVVTDIDGNAVAGVPIELDIVSVLESERYRDDAKVVEHQGCKLTSGTAPVSCAFHRELDHAMFAIAKVADARGRANVTELVIPWYSRDDKQPLAIVPDKTLYRPGDVAKLEIKSRTVPARAIVTFARQGVFEQQLIELAQPSTFVELPIAIGMIRNVHVQVDRIARRERQLGTDPRPLPEQVSAEVDLQVDLESARLDVRARPTAKLVQPGDDATFEIDVRHDDKPVADAEVALIVVDEAILALSSRSHGDPLLPFYRTVAGGTTPWNTLAMVHDSGHVLDSQPGFTRGELGGETGFGTIGSGSYGSIGHGSGGGGMGMGTTVTARKDFRPTAVFSPTLRTDARGHVSVTVKMPDSLTRYRVIALAGAQVHLFGKGEDTIVTQRKVNARTIAPRFLTQGDRFSLPVLVQNLDTKPRTISVAVRAANLTPEGPQGKRVTIPAGQRAEVRFGFATQRRGKAVIQTIMTSGGYADASNVELPVYEPATTEAFATYGVIDAQPQREQLAIPRDVFPEVGGVEVEIASTQLQALTDAYWYLEAYPYECAEQRSSRMLATTALYDILDQFATPGRPTRADLEAQRARDVAQLARTQRPDGGWGYFSNMVSDPMVSMQVLAALAAGDPRSIDRSPGSVVQRATEFATRQLAAAISKLSKRAAIPAADRRASDDDIYLVGLAAHALSQLARAGQDMRPRALQLHALATALKVYPVDAKARVLAVLAKQDRARAIRGTLVGELVAAIHETAATATVATSYVEHERLLLPSSTKTDALVLDALIREVPEHALIEKLARGVLAGRTHGRWLTTQDNLVALQAMRRYFDVFEKDTPSYTGKLWLGTAGYAEQRFVGRSSTRGVAQAGWTTLAPGTTHDLVFAREPVGAAPAAGRLYYRVGIVYAPKQVELPALDAGFVVRRRYTAVDDPADVVANPDGSYKIKLGAKVLVTIETTNTTTRHAVAVVDPMPAGFEAVNTALATAERAAVTDTDRWDHQNLRDNRAEAFDMEQPAGVHRYAYTVRATTPGSFIAAPAKAEEMYAPETFGRSNGMRVTIE